MKKNFISERKHHVNMNTMFHVVITLNNGLHKTLRVARWMVARIVARFQDYKKDIFNRTALVEVDGELLVLNDIKEMKIVYENTLQEFLTLA